MDIANREKIEWFNYWIEDANQGKKRILLIGDSVTRQYRKILNNVIATEGYVCDLIATSHSILDEVLEKELKFFFKTFSYPYKYIVFHLGAHHGYWIECSENSDDKSAYEMKVELLLKLISDNCEQVITLSGTHENAGSSIAGIEDIHNREIDARNCILKQISLKNKYLFIDLNLFMNKGNFGYTDWCHYERKADEYMANRIAEIILNKEKKEILNQVDGLRELNGILKRYSSIYLYGCGKKGAYVEKYLKLTKREFKGYIVSDQYYQGEEGVIRFSSFNQDEENAIVIVTAGDYQIFQNLHRSKMLYKSLSERLYIYIEEYVNAYME